MHLKVVALDLDGTIAENDVVVDATWELLCKAKKAGFVFILVTGRQLSALASIRPFEKLCDAIVAENGAVIRFLRNDAIMLPFGHLAPEVINELKARDIPMEEGLAIAATWRPHDRDVLEVLSKTSYAATVEYNKGAVMVLPPGATKGTGLMTALHELGYSKHNVVAVGDAENDRSLFEQAELAVAVSNTAEEIKAIADVVLPLENGRGVQLLLENLLQGAIPRHFVRSKNEIILGHNEDETPFLLNPLDLLACNLGIFGESGSGKSWLAGLLAERLLQLDYQICIIDPEGDHRGIRAFPHTLLLGDEKNAPPPVPNVVTLLEYSDISLILDLSLYKMEEQSKYVTDLLYSLCGLRNHRGRPHWFLIDEVHYFCSSDEAPITKLMLNYMNDGGLGLVSYRPSQVAPSLLKMLDHWLLTRVSLQEELKILDHYLTNEKWSDLEKIPGLNSRQAYLYLGETVQKDAIQSGIVNFETTKRIIPHVRHLHKYLRAPLADHKRFYFYVNDNNYQGSTTAASLWEFSQLIPKLPLSTLMYHMERRDFEKWLQKTLHDEELARRIRKIHNRNLSENQLRETLAIVVDDRFRELESLI